MSDGLQDNTAQGWDGQGAGRPTHGASVAPDAHAVAHIVDDGGYPRAVQRFLDGSRVSSWRYVTLPVEGPITRVEHSPDGAWLACQVAPHGEGRTQVWVVTTDPSDPDAWPVHDSRDGAVELVGWEDGRIMVTAERNDGLGESRLVDPATLELHVIDVRPEGRLLDSWAGATLVRTGGRGDRAVRLLWRGRDLALLPDDPGSVSDRAVVLDDRRPGLRRRRRHEVRVLVRSDVGVDRQRLLLCTVDEHGKTTTEVLAERKDAELDAFCASLDGTRAALLWNVDGGCSQAQLLDLSARALYPPLKLPGGSAGAFPRVLAQPSLSSDGNLLALTFERPDRDRSVELFDLRAGTRTEVDEFRSDPRAVAPTLEHFTARDGLALTGWLHRAPVPGGPVLVHLHGGPEGQERPGFSHLYPELLEAGISVFAPNVRGSAGFGRAFSHADDGPLRPGSISDVADAIEHLLRIGLAQPGRVAVAGWSYGGYLTMATLAFNPGVAACGIAVSGMSNLRTFYATTERWIARAAVPKYGDPQTQAAMLSEFSPLRRAHLVRDPLLMVHGLHDTNVPPTESQQMADAVHRAGGEARVVILDDEGHEVSKPENRRALAHLVRDEVLARLGTPPSTADGHLTKKSTKGDELDHIVKHG